MVKKETSQQLRAARDEIRFGREQELHFAS
jgi:hypothetical protein